MAIDCWCGAIGRLSIEKVLEAAWLMGIEKKFELNLEGQIV